MKLFEFKSEPCHEQYSDLIEYACSQSDAVMLVFSVKKGSILQNYKTQKRRKMLSQWRIKTRHDANWPVTISYDTRYSFMIDLYKPSPEVKDFLLSVPSLYAWGKHGLPEDLAFFLDHECWLATCSHEEFGWILSQNKLPIHFMDFLAIVTEPNDVSFHEEY